MKTRIGEVLEKTEKMKGKKGGKRWWDEECRERKEQVRRELGIWIKQRVNKEKYRKEDIESYARERKKRREKGE